MADSVESDSHNNTDSLFVWDESSQLYFHARFSLSSLSLSLDFVYLFPLINFYEFAVVGFTTTQVLVGTTAPKMVFTTNSRMEITCFFLFIRYQRKTFQFIRFFLIVLYIY